MKRIFALIISFSFLMPFRAFSEYSVVFTDDSGEIISLTKRPEKTAVLFSSFAEMWAVSGGEISVTVRETVERGIVSEDIILVDSGAGKKIDFEALSLSDADFVIGSTDIPVHKEARDLLKKTGVPFALFGVESIEDYLRVLDIMTRINQNEEAYTTFGTLVYEESMKVIQTAKAYSISHPQNILFIRSGAGYSSAKAKTKEMHFAAKMLDELGAENIADEVPVIIDGLSFEEIYMKDPDAIFISLMGNEEAARAYMESVLSKKEWQALSAVKNSRCYFLEKDLFQFKPNHKWAAAYEEMAKMLYPEWLSE